MSQPEKRGTGRRAGFVTHHVLINIVKFAIVLAVVIAAIQMALPRRPPVIPDRGAMSNAGSTTDRK